MAHPSRNMRFYWRLVLGTQSLICACGLGELLLGLMGLGWVQAALGGAVLVLGGVTLVLRWRAYRKLTPEQLEQTISENRRTKFRFRWPEEEARLKPDDEITK